MGKCYYYGKEKNEIKAFENHNTSNETQKSDEVKRIIIDDNTELVIEKDTIYEIDRKCEKCRRRMRVIGKIYVILMALILKTKGGA